LNFSVLRIAGRILEVGEDYLKLEPITNLGIRTTKKIKQIEYHTIKDYKFTKDNFEK